MLSRTLLVSFLLLSTLSMVSAEGLIPISPVDGASIVPSRDRFVFSVETREQIVECSLILDGETARTNTYSREILFGRSISYAASAEEGTHTWSVECVDVNGLTIRTDERTFSIAPTSTVKVTSSGVNRGSMRRQFEFKNSPDQPPVIIDKIAAGDFIAVVFSLPPSKITKEFYVRSRLAKDGRDYLWLTYKQSNYYLYVGENTTVDIGSTTILMEFSGIQNNRATVTAYPNITRTVTEDPSVDNNSSSGSSQEEGSELPEDNVDEESSESEPVEETPEEPVEMPEDPASQEPEPPQQQQSAMTRFLSWLAHIFGT